MIVKIKPIDRKKWHGKKGKESFSQPIGIQALYDSETGLYATGLSDDKKNELEKKTNFNLSPIFNPNKPHEFWDSRAGTLFLENNTILLNTIIPLDEIRIHLAKASKFVANSVRDLDEGLYPEATHVIFDEDEEISVKAKKIELTQKAYSAAKKLTKSTKVNIILILSGKSVRQQSNDYIEVELNKIITTKPVEFLSYVNKPVKYLNDKGLVLEAILSNILIKRATGIFYMDELLGGTVEDTIDYLNDSKNQNLKIIILDKLV